MKEKITATPPNMKVNKHPFMAICALAVLVAAGVFSLNAHAQCNVYMGTSQQVIDGYGFSSAWCGQLSTAKNNSLYNTLGMSILRVRIDDNNNWGDEIANAANAHAAGVKVFGTAWSGPGAWIDTQQSMNGSLLPQYYADYANWLGQAASAHNLDWVSPANESDLGWMSWTSDQLRTWIGQYGACIGRPMLAPESCWFSDSYGNPILDDPKAGPNVVIYGGHYYGNGPAVHQDALDKGKHVWMTEFYFDGPNDMGVCMQIAQQISDSMNCQLSAYVWWWDNDSDTNTVLVTSDGTINKNGYTMGQFAKWIRPGSTRVTADYHPSSGISVTAYNVNGSAVIVAVNTSTTGSVNQQFTIHNGSAAAFEGYRTSSSQSMADIGSFAVSGGIFTANLPAQSITTFVQTNGTSPNLPPPWTAQDIGSVGVVGSTTYTNSVVTNGVFTVTASGNDIWNTADGCRFVYETNGGNSTILARVRSEQSTNAMAKAGVMIRDSLNPGAANAFIGVTPGNGLIFQYRSSTGGGSISNNVTGISAPCWVKLVRSGNTFTGYSAPDGTNWTQQGTATFTMASTAYLGLAVTAHNNSSLCMAAFDNVSAPGWPIPPPSVPTGLTATAGVEQVILNWQAGNYATSNNVGRATVSGGPYTTIATVRGTGYIDADLVGGTTYYYVVKAFNGAGQSTNSAPASATPTANLPSPWVAQDIGAVGVGRQCG
jgi:glucuronoarabinoxylan endo-1,4-beta-xylanase